ncbi:hypothetical protein GGR51DRAFT_543440 [Nemania sp. FL0031]|nr:hypothetical protein GGR51DRAFT_543440 [Nemania sp. FL0031]
MNRTPHGSLRVLKSCTSHLGSLSRRITSANCGSGQLHNFDPVTSSKLITELTTYDGGAMDVDSFRRLAWEKPGAPIRLRGFHRLPAMERWFTRSGQGRDQDQAPITLSEELEPFSSTLVPYELVVEEDGLESLSASSLSCLQHFQAWLSHQPAKQDDVFLGEFIDHLIGSVENRQSSFIRFDAPLGLIIQATRYNKSTRSPSCRLRNLYIAQCDIPSLPVPMAQALTTPNLVREGGRRDIYGSSIWLGLQPTYTPLHRDPNPNLFCQLVGSKAVRLMPPNSGLSVFQEVRKKLGISGNSRIRGADMMYGPERDELHHAVWVKPSPSKFICGGVLEPGDALFIPQGWWHSFWSVGKEAEINASANWWFR